jgi:hypothetical protein
MSQNNNYPVDSESDEEDEDENTTIASGHINWHMQDIDKVWVVRLIDCCSYLSLH